MEPIRVIGVEAGDLPFAFGNGFQHVRRADFLAGGERHLSRLLGLKKARFVIRNNLPELVEELRKRRTHQKCVVLATGDPLFYGIGTFLSETFGPDAVHVIPRVSSMQLAFARVGVSWQDAELASIHGRDVRMTLLPLLGQPKVGLFTQDGDSPAAVARFFLDRGLDDYEAIVAENLGNTDEQITRLSNLAELAERRFGPLNFLILLRQGSAEALAQQQRLRDLVPGVPDSAFVRAEGKPEVMTRQEVRAVLLGKLGGLLRPGDTVWDIGAGLGTVAIEIAVLRPGVEVVAVERDPERAALLRLNRQRFGTYNVRVVEGEAPAALAGEAIAPRLVFIGGSGSRLRPILDHVAAWLLPGCRLLAHFVTLENLAEALQRIQQWGWPFAVTELQVARSVPLAGRTTLKPLRGVFLVQADRPETLP